MRSLPSTTGENPVGKKAARAFAGVLDSSVAVVTRGGFEHQRELADLDLPIHAVDGTTRVRPPGDVTPPNRPLELQKAGPWRVAIPADQVRTKSVVEVLHRCHPFWMTRTRFYP